MSIHAYISRSDIPLSISMAVRRCEEIEEPVWSFSGCGFSATLTANEEFEFVVPREWAARRALFEWFEYVGIPYRVLP
ncbi:hypothetical protein [Burkholderia gladioli]|uniref:hypothetical protein n=1 Tax=Burkholderia gladioli TaxID=28095 RepID=UPI003EE35154